MPNLANEAAKQFNDGPESMLQVTETLEHRFHFHFGTRCFKLQS
jgi:hypothetical protein